MESSESTSRIRHHSPNHVNHVPGHVYLYHIHVRSLSLRFSLRLDFNMRLVCTFVGGILPLASSYVEDEHRCGVLGACENYALNFRPIDGVGSSVLAPV